MCIVFKCSKHMEPRSPVGDEYDFFHRDFELCQHVEYSCTYIISSVTKFRIELSGCQHVLKQIPVGCSVVHSHCYVATLCVRLCPHVCCHSTANFCDAGFNLRLHGFVFYFLDYFIHPSRYCCRMWQYITRGDLTILDANVDQSLG